MAFHRFLTFKEQAAADREASLRRRLLWLYGPERAAAILEGEDPKAEADVQAWDALRQDRSHGR